MRLTTIVLALALALLSWPLPAGSNADCTPGDVRSGRCEVDPVTGQLVVAGEIVRPSPPVEPEDPGEGGRPAPPASPPNLIAECQTWRDDSRICFRAGITPLPPGSEEEAPTPVERPITIADVAIFRPIVGELVVEPDGWGVVGTPTNFYATAETHTMDGELFDTPIQVRWTPSSYRFDYGDGTVEETDASGAAWNGTEESWTETATSHTYAAREDVTASVTVIFTAEVNAGSGWFAVPGSLPVDTPGVTVKVFEVDTVLTDGDCMADPSAAGCG